MAGPFWFGKPRWCPSNASLAATWRGADTGSTWRASRSVASSCQKDSGAPTGSQNPSSHRPPKQNQGTTRTSLSRVMSDALGLELASRLRALTLEIYSRGAALALEKGLILADTKFEFGLLDDGQILLIDEVLTPDSSRFWDSSLWSARHRAHLSGQAICAELVGSVRMGSQFTASRAAARGGGGHSEALQGGLREDHGAPAPPLANRRIREK